MVLDRRGRIGGFLVKSVGKTVKTFPRSVVSTLKSSVENFDRL